MPQYKNTPFAQVLKVRTDEVDGNDDGHEWNVHYVLYEVEDDDEEGVFFDLYEDDGEGNGKRIARGTNLVDMRSLTLKLGKFVEWKPTEKED